MKTLEEIKEDFAKSRGHVSWKAYLERGSTFGGEIAVDLLDFTYSEIAHSYADQFKSKWIPVACGYPDHFNPVLGKFIASNGDEHYHIVSLYVTRHCKTIFTDVLGESQVSITEWIEIPTAAPERKEDQL